MHVGIDDSQTEPNTVTVYKTEQNKNLHKTAYCDGICPMTADIFLQKNTELEKTFANFMLICVFVKY